MAAQAGPKASQPAALTRALAFRLLHGIDQACTPPPPPPPHARTHARTYAHTSKQHLPCLPCRRRTKRFEAHIWGHKQQVYLGSFDQGVQAARAHDIMALCNHGGVVYPGSHNALNFPPMLYAELLPFLGALSQASTLACACLPCACCPSLHPWRLPCLYCHRARLAGSNKGCELYSMFGCSINNAVQVLYAPCATVCPRSPPQ
jgi:hypothetical protein